MGKADVPFVWDAVVEQEFQRTKTILSSPMGLQPFRIDWLTIVFCDYSRRGIGYLLVQQHPTDPSRKHIVFMGSVRLSPTQRHLPAIYGESLAIVTALRKLHFYLRGCPHFVIRSDQSALVNIYNSKHLEDMSEQIQEDVISTFKYNFTMQHISGKANTIADFLSRHPLWDETEEIFGPQAEDEFGISGPISHQVHVASLQRNEQRIQDDPQLQD